MSGWAFYNIGTMSGQAVGIDSTSINLSSWDSTAVRITTFGTTAQAFTGVEFKHEPTSNRIKVKMYKGTNAAFATLYYSYINYTGLATATWEAKYEFATQSAPGAASETPVPSPNTYTSVPTNIYRQFYWSAEVQADDAPGIDQVNATGVVFTLRATLGAATYTIASVPRGNVSCYAQAYSGQIP